MRSSPARVTAGALLFGALVICPLAAASAADAPPPETGPGSFAFDRNGLIVQPDSTDNEAGHTTLNHESGTEVAFTICNLAESNGTGRVDIYVDDNYVKSWRSSVITPGGCQGTNVHGIGRYPAGRHVFRALVTPGAAGGDQAENSVDID